MNRTPAVSAIEHRFRDQERELAARTQLAWTEYLRTTRSCAATIYAEAEPIAWRRLRRSLAALCHDRRRSEFERDRALADAVHDYLLAS
jgi:hypothetical protein